MEYFIQQSVNGITLGSIYGLIAIGYTMVYGIIGMINFAHGDIFMVGAFVALISFILFALTGISLPIVLILVLLIAIFFPRRRNMIHSALAKAADSSGPSCPIQPMDAFQTPSNKPPA